MWNPFRKFAEREQAILDQLQASVDKWEAALIAGRYSLLPYAWQVLKNDGGLSQARVYGKMEAAAWARLEQREDYETIRTGWELEYKRVWAPKEYQLIMLRQEIEALRKKVAQFENIEAMIALGTPAN